QRTILDRRFVTDHSARVEFLRRDEQYTVKAISAMKNLTGDAAVWEIPDIAAKGYTFKVVSVDKSGRRARAVAVSEQVAGADASPKLLAQLRLAEAYYHERDYPAARAGYAKVLEMAEATPAQKSKAQFQIGCTYFFHERDFARARAEYAKVLEMADATPFYKSSAQLQMGCSYFYEEKYPAAVTEFTKVLALPTADAKDKFKSRIKQHKLQAKEFIRNVKSGKMKDFSLR
ncbi:MAG: tetratricopeptide repeat protein, partial [Phycisphaerae bacterium]|nr:tetratricopeptide repeat protein [Phycisphaerae bacterium]